MNLMLGLAGDRGTAVKLLVKLGGTLLDARGVARRAWRRRSPRARAQGIEIVVVHGGGKQMTRFLAERGIESRFVNGLRVTTPETHRRGAQGLRGHRQSRAGGRLNRAGALAVGLSGIDACLVEAEQMDPALGAVGRVTRSNPGAAGPADGERVPAGGGVRGRRPAGHILQRECRSDGGRLCGRLRGRQLIFLTDVEGVLDGAKQVRAAADRRGERAADRGRRRHRRHAGEVECRASGAGGRRRRRCGSLPARGASAGASCWRRDPSAHDCAGGGATSMISGVQADAFRGTVRAPAATRWCARP